MIAHLRNTKPSILVIGDLMIDHYLWGNCSRISPEAPVQVVDIAKESNTLGGAGNVLHNLCALNADVNVISVIGDDENGIEMCKMLENLGISQENIIIEQQRKTSKKSRILASNQQMLRFDQESKNDISLDSETSILKRLEKYIDSVDCLILSDYGKGVLTTTLTQAIIKKASQYEKKVLVDPKGTDYTKYSGAYLLTPNKKEAEEATGIIIKDKESLYQASKKLYDLCRLGVSLITLSEDGIAIYAKELITVPTVAKEVFDVTGAGDTVIASLAYAICGNRSIEDAARFANAAAAVVVGKIGSATASFDEIEAYMASLHHTTADMHLKDISQIEAISLYAKKEGKKVVFTNGCFDILHLGHVRYLEEAKNFGDILIIGLNSDASVRRLKGNSRPINSEYDRAYLLAALEVVDYVVIFDEDTPFELIKSVKPDILVKGADYAGKEVVGSDLVKEVRLVTFVEGKSTSNTILAIAKGKGCC